MGLRISGSAHAKRRKPGSRAGLAILRTAKTQAGTLIQHDVHICLAAAKQRQLWIFAAYLRHPVQAFLSRSLSNTSRIPLLRDVVGR